MASITDNSAEQHTPTGPQATANAANLQQQNELFKLIAQHFHAQLATNQHLPNQQQSHRVSNLGQSVSQSSAPSTSSYLEAASAASLHTTPAILAHNQLMSQTLCTQAPTNVAAFQVQQEQHNHLFANQLQQQPPSLFGCADMFGALGFPFQQQALPPAVPSSQPSLTTINPNSVSDHLMLSLQQHYLLQAAAAAARHQIGQVAERLPNSVANRPSSPPAQAVANQSGGLAPDRRLTQRRVGPTMQAQRKSTTKNQQQRTTAASTRKSGLNFSINTILGSPHQQTLSEQLCSLTSKHTTTTATGRRVVRHEDGSSDENDELDYEEQDDGAEGESGVCERRCSLGEANMSANKRPTDEDQSEEEGTRQLDLCSPYSSSSVIMSPAFKSESIEINSDRQVGRGPPQVASGASAIDQLSVSSYLEQAVARSMAAAAAAAEYKSEHQSDNKQFTPARSHQLAVAQQYLGQQQHQLSNHHHHHQQQQQHRQAANHPPTIGPGFAQQQQQNNSTIMIPSSGASNTNQPVGVPSSFPWTMAARGKPRRGMMRRAVFSDSQRVGLEKRFQLQKYISKPDRKKLAEKLGLRDSQVKIWFQNRRMKWRNSKERELLSAGGSREQTLPTRNNPNPDLSDVGETIKRLQEVGNCSLATKVTNANASDISNANQTTTEASCSSAEATPKSLVGK